MDTQSGEIQITAEGTPNPNTVKFSINRTILESGSADFPYRATAAGSPLASKVFAIEAVSGVFIGRDFVSVTKAHDADWEQLIPVVDIIKQHILSGEPAVTQMTPREATEAQTEIEKKIVEILDNEIRPAVAMDGGDIIFQGYDEGIVTLYLQGSCSSCPSSMMTLKMGVETRLRAAIPEIREVVQV